MKPEFSHHLGDLFTSSREKGKNGLPHYSVTLNNGLVLRNSLERRTDTNIDDTAHLLIRKGYIAYNMMRVWQGALGLANADGIVSPAYVILKPSELVDSQYAEYLFKTRRMIYLFWAFSYGLTNDRLRLYYRDFARIKVNVPDIQEQKKIAKILQTWDRAIATTEKLIDASKQQKKALMQQLLTGKKRLADDDGKLFDNKWQTVTLGDLGETYTSLTGKSRDDFGTGNLYIPYLNIYKNPSIDTCSLERVKIGHNEKQNAVQYGDIFFTTSSEVPEEVGMSSVMLTSTTTPIYLNSFCFGFRPKDLKQSTPEFMKYILRSSDVRRSITFLAQGATRYNLSKKQLLKVHLSLPNSSEQKKIAAVLTNADNQIERQTQQLARFKQEKKALMQQLLTGNRRVKVDE